MTDFQHEDFEGGADGVAYSDATARDGLMVWDSTGGTFIHDDASALAPDSVRGGLLNVSAAYRYGYGDITPATVVWVTGYIQPENDPASNLILSNVYSGDNRQVELQYRTTTTLRMRNKQSSAIGGLEATPLVAGTRYRIAYKVDVTNGITNADVTLRVYEGDSLTPRDDLDASGVDVSGLTSDVWRFGAIASTSIADLRVDGWRIGDTEWVPSTTEPPTGTRPIEYTYQGGDATDIANWV